MTSAKRFLLAWIVALVWILFPLFSAPAERTSATPTNPLALLQELVVASPQNSTSYERTYFPHWRNAGRRCLDTREEVLIRESKIAIAPTCEDIDEGLWTSLYDGKTVRRASELEIDHVVALKEAWVSGAWQWTREKRKAFANDLGYSGSLLAVTIDSHDPKGDKDPSSWIPTRGACEFVRHWVAVKWRWQLTIDPAEKKAVSRVLKGNCGERAIFVTRNTS